VSQKKNRANCQEKDKRTFVKKGACRGTHGEKGGNPLLQRHRKEKGPRGRKKEKKRQHAKRPGVLRQRKEKGTARKGKQNRSCKELTPHVAKHGKGDAKKGWPEPQDSLESGKLKASSNPIDHREKRRKKRKGRNQNTQCPLLSQGFGEKSRPKEDEPFVNEKKGGHSQ